MSVCGLCGSDELQPYHQDKRRRYLQCTQCALVIVDERDRLSSEDEKAIYDTHENSLHDEGYRRFLSRAFEPTVERVPSHSKGLDFGCGPGPLLAEMFKEVGFEMACFDLFYANEPEVLTKTYDFVTCTEVIEHLSQPGEVLAKLLSLLDAGGPLVLMTKLIIDQNRFAQWHYKNDLTHIVFFSRETFNYVAAHFDCQVEFIGNDVIVLTKSKK